ncbi:Armadillo repeat-containing protein 2 [Phlyctochytrium bullatum]|nr:Armadillo repeat-containing protein 2 [Phlyctochytrium bullatum]
MSQSVHEDEDYGQYWEKLKDVLADISRKTRDEPQTFQRAKYSQLEVVFDELFENLSHLRWLRSLKTSKKSQDCDEDLMHQRRAEKEKRDFVLNSLMKWMESSGHPVVAIGVCGILLRLTHDERVLLNTLKLLFKLSKNEKNDKLFQSHRVLESVLDFLCPCSSGNNSCSGFSPAKLGPKKGDLFVYAAGILKNITHNDESCKALLNWGVLSRFKTIFATLTNTSNCIESCKDLIPHLMMMTDDAYGFSDSSELMLNISRVLR